MSNEQRLKDLGIILPPPRPPAFGYVPVVVEGGLAWVSGQLPWNGDGLMAKGRLGDGVDVETGRAVARCCLLNGLSVLREALGSLDRVKRVVKVVGGVPYLYIYSAPSGMWTPVSTVAANHLPIPGGNVLWMFGI